MRLFFALRMDLELLPSLKTAVAKLKRDAADKDWDLKFTPTSNYHVTLQFVGEGHDDHLARMTDAAKRVAHRHAPFRLLISGLDAFPEIHHARVIWAGVQNKKNLQALQQDLAQELSFLNLEPEGAFVPHLTMARLRNPRSVKSFLSPFERKDFGSVSCESIGLFKSEQRGHYPHYECIEDFKLSPTISAPSALRPEPFEDTD